MNINRIEQKESERQSSKIEDLHKRWIDDPEYRTAYDELGPEFDLIRSVILSRMSAGLTQAQLAERMNTTQSAIARLEGGARRHRSRRCCGLHKPQELASRSASSHTPATTRDTWRDGQDRQMR